MKKVILIFMICFLAFSLITGCGGNGSQESPTPSANTPTENENTSANSAAPSPDTKEESIADMFKKSLNVEMEMEYVIESPEGRLEGKQWIKGKNIRMEMKAEGIEAVTIINYDKGEAYNYIPEENMGVIMDITEIAEMYYNPADDWQNTDFDGAEIIETTTYEGMKCKVVYNKDEDGTETKLWLSEQYGIPLRVEEVDAWGAKTVIEYKNIKIGSVSNVLFSLPEGIEVFDMGGM